MASSASWTDAPCTQVTRLAAAILGTPIALLSLPRAEDYRFRVNIGLDGFDAVPRRISFCAYTMLGTDVMVVSDARVDPRFHQNPLVLEAPHVVTYVGLPLISSRGVTLGTLCGIDRQPRTFTESQLDQLREVGRIAAWLLEIEGAPRAVSDDPSVQAQQLEAERFAERERIAIVLHEGVAQELFALRLVLQRLRTSGAWRPEADPKAAAVGADIIQALDRSINDVCGIANRLVTQGSMQQPIAEAIRQHAQEVALQSGLEIQTHESGEVANLDSATRLLTLRVVRESLADIARHARACHVSIFLECGAEGLRLRVVDDGLDVGSDAALAAGGLYLTSLRERARAAGGTLSATRNVHGGSTLCLQLPAGVTRNH